MGYESKVFIVEHYTFIKDFEGNLLDNPIHSAIVVAEYDLSKMGYDNSEFYKVFKKEIDYKLWMLSCDDDGNEIGMDVDTDCYGEHMKSADIGELIEVLKRCEAREHYRRIPPLIAMLEAFKLDEWNNAHCTLEAVHYGY